MRSVGTSGFRLVPSALSGLTVLVVLMNVTWYTLPFAATVRPAPGGLSRVRIPGRALRAFAIATLGASKASGTVLSLP